MADPNNQAAVKAWGVAMDGMLAQGLAHAEKQVKAIVLDAAARVINRSPVDTGFFRSQWSVLIGIKPSLTPMDRAAAKPGASGIHASPIGEMVATISGITLTGPTQIWVVNPTVYGPALENGHSGQAPKGMVGITLLELQGIYGGVIS